MFFKTSMAAIMAAMVGSATSQNFDFGSDVGRYIGPSGYGGKKPQKSKHSPAKDRRQAAKRKAVKRARRLGHA